MNRSKRRKNDPTDERGRRKRATRALTSRLTGVQRVITERIKGLPAESRSQTVIANEIKIIWDYDLSPAELQALSVEIRALMDDAMDTAGQTAPVKWFWADQMEPAYRKGAAEELVRFNQLLAAQVVAGDVLLSAVPLEQYLQSREYLAGLRNVVVREYDILKGFSGDTSADIFRTISEGVNAGRSPTQVARAVRERFDVSKGRAKRIADTEINRAHNEAKLDAVKVAENRTGLRAGVLHISALLPTTRESHAVRHGNAYTVEEQRQWWDQGANRISCKCSTTSVLLDSKGRVVQREDQEQLKDERQFFER